MSVIRTSPSPKLKSSSAPATSSLAGTESLVPTQAAVRDTLDEGQRALEESSISQNFFSQIGNLPNNVEAEKAVIAAAIMDNEATEEIIAAVRPDMFYRDSHRIIFNHIIDLKKAGKSVDQVTLSDSLASKGELDRIGGKLALIELGNHAMALSNWQSHLAIVERDAMLRDMIRAASKITKLGNEAQGDVKVVVDAAEELLLGVTNKHVKTDFVEMKELVMSSLNEIESIKQNKHHLLGVRSGYKDLDDTLLGMRAGDLIVLAARPGIGKTAFALNVGINAAKQGTKVALFSLEMPKEQVNMRIISAEGKVDLKKLRSGQLSQVDMNQAVQAANTLSPLPFAIDDSASLSIMELRAKARRYLRYVETGAGLIIVDYLQLMDNGTSSYRDRHLEVGDITRGLKMLAKELGVPILALAQLSRGVEGRGDKRPILSDLRESGSIEQDADVVMFLDRSTSEVEASEPRRPDLGMANLIIGKNRNGETRDIPLVFQAQYTGFASAVRNTAQYQQVQQYTAPQSTQTSAAAPAHQATASAASQATEPVAADEPF